MAGALQGVHLYDTIDTGERLLGYPSTRRY